jgi:hypothetical protein
MCIGVCRCVEVCADVLKYVQMIRDGSRCVEGCANV